MSRLGVDINDGLFTLAVALVASGLYFVYWPLVLVAAGAGLGFVWVRRL